MKNSPFALPISGQSSRTMLTLYRLAACIFGGWITMLLLVPDPYATSRALEPVRHAHLNGYFIHFSVYTLVTTFLLSSLRERGSVVWNGLVWLLLSHACFTEILQANVPGRTADVFDSLANICGISVGILLDRILRAFFRAEKRPAAILPVTVNT